MSRLFFLNINGLVQRNGGGLTIFRYKRNLLPRNEKTAFAGRFFDGSWSLRLIEPVVTGLVEHRYQILSFQCSRTQGTTSRTLNI
uniref:Uncharacterized protein n=1 Tax=Edwardsiella tarda TaxID=636 RepID=A0A2S1PMS9_EDWTA|nr:hypothetical protein [Edwardsiella tarda]